MVTTTTVFFLFSSFLSWYFLLALYLRSLGANENQIGMAYVLTGAALNVTQVPGGYLADKYGRRLLLAIPTFVFPLLYLVAVFSSNWVLVVAALSISMAIMGLQMPPSYSIIAESVEEKDQEVAFGIFGIAVAASFAIGPGVGSFFTVSVDGIRAMMITTAALALPCGLARHFLIRDVMDHSAEGINLKKVIKAVDKNVILCLIAFIFFTFLIDTTIYGPFITLFSKDFFGLKEQPIQIMFTIGGVMGVIMSIFCGYLTRKLGAKKAFILGCLGHAILFIPWMHSRSYNEMLAIYSTTFIFLQLSFVAHDMLITNLTEIKTRSSVIGFVNTVAGFLGALAPRTCSQLAVSFGPKAPFYAAVVFAVLASVYAGLIQKNRS